MLKSTNNTNQLITDLIAVCPNFVDLTSKEHAQLIVKITNKLIKEYRSLSKINAIEKQLINQKNKALIFILLAFKMAKSKLITNKITTPITISVVFAVYKEHNRIKKNTEHPHGEDFLRKKVAQLEWLFNNNSNIIWELIVVDDGCPENSGKIAQEIIITHQLSDKVKVLFLADAIQQKLLPVKSLFSTDDSQKGGSISYGMWHAAQQSKSKNHIIIYTDADLSTHLGQVGLLIEPLLHQKKRVAIGSRREPDSVVVKKGTRNNRGKLFIYLWKRLIPNLDNIIDTQCGFKAFRKEIITTIINDLIEHKFAFDIELLLKTAQIEQNSISKVPVAWIDSEQASTTTDLQPYLPMLKSIAKMYKKYFPSNQLAEEFATFILDLNENEFKKIVDNIPSEIVNKEPFEFTKYNGVGVDDLIRNIR